MRRLLLTGSAMLLALPVSAEEAAHGGGGQLPQFQAQYFPGQLFWLAVSFLVLYLLLKNVALPRIAQPQEARQAQRSADLAVAAEANEHAKQVLATYEKSLSMARQQSQQKLAAITQAAQDHAAQQQKAQQQQLQQKLAEAEKQIAANRVKALAEVPAAASAVTQAIVQQLAGLDVNAAAVIDRLKQSAA